MADRYEYTCAAGHHEIFTGLFAKRRYEKWLAVHKKCKPDKPTKRVILCRMGPPPKDGSDKSI